MKKLPLVEVLVVNAFLIPLLVLITENYSLRAAYWVSEGFTSTTVRYPFFFITSAVKGSTHIPGLLSVDWQQVVLVVLLLTDAVYAWSALKSSRRGASQTSRSP
jgi:hypothetical protein